MTLEIARRLGQDGVTWETVVVDEDTGGGSQPVSVLLTADPVDAHEGFAPLKWTDLHNNPFDFDPLVAIPAGLGLSFAFDGSDATITTTAAGVWALTLIAVCPVDATWRATLELDVNLGSVAGPLGSTASPSVHVAISETLWYPAGATIAPQFFASVAATADPYNVACFLAIVRLA